MIFDLAGIESIVLMVLTALAGVIAMVLRKGVALLDRLIDATPTKIDDKLRDIVKDALRDELNHRNDG